MTTGHMFVGGSPGYKGYWRASDGEFYTKGDIKTESNVTVIGGGAVTCGSINASSGTIAGDVRTTAGHFFAGASNSNYWRASDGEFSTLGHVFVYTSIRVRTASPLADKFVADNTGQVNCRRLDTTGDVWCSTLHYSGSLAFTSDARLKDVVPDVSDEEVCARCFADLGALPVRAFRYKTAAPGTYARVGPMAQDILALGEDSFLRVCVRAASSAGTSSAAEGVSNENEQQPTVDEVAEDPAKGTLYVDLNTMTGAILAATKHAIREVGELRAENEELRAALTELTALTARVTALESV